MLRLRLKHGLPGRAWVDLKSLAGVHELSINHSAPTAFVELVEKLIVETDELSIKPGEAMTLSLCDLDIIAAYLQINYFGSRIESTPTCKGCRKAFDLNFDFSPLLTSVEENLPPSSIAGPDLYLHYRLEDGRRFRLPSAQDAFAVRLLPGDRARDQLRSYCSIDSDFIEDPETLESALEAVGPLISREVRADCPHCGRTESIRFDLPSYFLESLGFERRYLAHEIHYLARGYGWSRSEILDMDREDRRLHTRLLLSTF